MTLAGVLFLATALSAATAGPLFVRIEGPSGCVYAAAREFSTAPRFACVKAPGARRVFLIGNSLVKGLEPPSSVPGLELIPVGLPGYDSARELSAARELLALHPDLLVVMSGSNEAGPLPEAALARNLRELSRLARAARVPVLFATTPVAIAALPPRGAEPLGDRDYFEGRWKAWGGDHAGALAALEARLRRAPGDAHALYWAGRGLVALGRVREARARLEDAVRRGGPGRMTPDRNEVVRRVAREEGIGLADLDAAFRAAALGGLVGFDWMASDDHWRRDRRGFASDALFSAKTFVALSGSVPLWAGKSPPPDPMDAPEFHLGMGVIEWRENGSAVSPARLSERVIARALRAFETLDERAPEELWRRAETAAGMDPFWAGKTVDLRTDRELLYAHWAEALRRRGECAPAARLAEAAGTAPQALWARALLAASCPSARAAGEQALSQLRALGPYPEAAFLAQRLSAKEPRPGTRADARP